MNSKYIILFLLAALQVFSGCEDLMEPLDDNHYLLEDIYDDPSRAEGLIFVAYTEIPSNFYSLNEVATDDAVTNDKFNDYRQVATGQWSAINNPFSNWTGSLKAIQYINKFLEEADKVDWAYSNEVVDELFYKRNIGEAYGLRALHMFYLLQSHAGYDISNQLLGVPVMDRFYESMDDFQQPRNTFEQCMQQLYADIDSALKYLPLDYTNIRNESDLPAIYNFATKEEYNRAFGSKFASRMSARIAMAYRAKAALLAASPAYDDGTGTSWAHAANYAGEILSQNNGITGLNPNGWLFFIGTEVEGHTFTKSGAEIIWRTNKGIASNMEETNFPPSLYGNGRVNPTQNLVNAFPMANGYPVSHASSGYDAANPYANRDPRLEAYIVFNGSLMSESPINIETGSGDDAINNISTSTRTGYYLRKLLREDVNLDPASSQGQNHFTVRLRYTELYLIYAEAANEAWGPDGTGSFGFSARDVIAAIRERAGILQPDEYLNSITTTEEMRNLIRNERRLELCFEGFRFWDLRRWKEDITEPATGMSINNETYEEFTVESRLYEDYMYYPPVPFTEVLKFGLIQNAGW